MSVGQIAQLIVPADGLGSIQLMVPDYARGRLFGIGIHSGSPSGGCLRAYSLSLVTQSPSLSVETNAWGSSLQMGPEAPVDIDPVTGNIIGQWYAGTVLSPIRKINPVTLTLTASYGITANLGSYPAGIELAENVICVACGTLAARITAGNSAAVRQVQAAARFMARGHSRLQRQPYRFIKSRSRRVRSSTIRQAGRRQILT
jgi:hypothetical protein